MYEDLDGHPITDILDRFPNSASHGHAIGQIVMDHSIPSYLMVIGMMVAEVVVPSLHVIVPAVVPFLAASVVFVQLVFFPSSFPDQVVLPIAALEAWLLLESLPVEVGTLAAAMVEPVLVPVAAAVLALLWPLGDSLR